MKNLIILSTVILLVSGCVKNKNNDDPVEPIEQRSYIETVEKDDLTCYRVMPVTRSRYDNVSHITTWTCEKKPTK